MANPKLENGYTRIVNDLLESIYSTNFNATEFKILLFIMRYTYGFNRKEHMFSLTFISKGIGVSKRYVSSSINNLIKDNILIVTQEHTDNTSRIIKINKDFDKWQNRIIIQQMNCSSTDEVESNTTGEEQFHSTGEAEFNTTGEEQFYQEIKYINKNIKENIKKEDIPFYLSPVMESETVIKFTLDSFEMLCVETIINSCLELYPNSKVPSTYKEKEKWAIEIDRLKRIDKRGEEEIKKALQFAVNDGFWKPNIRSAKKFREKFETLIIQANRNNSNVNKINRGQQLQDQFVENMKGWLNDTDGLC